MARNRLQTMVEVTPEQRERLDALRARGVVVARIFRRALDVVIASQAERDELGERLALEVAEDADASARERQLAELHSITLRRLEEMTALWTAATEREARYRAALRKLERDAGDALQAR